MNAEVGYRILPAGNDTFSVDDHGFIKVKNPSKLDRESGNGTMDIKVWYIYFFLLILPWHFIVYPDFLIK